MTKVVLNSWLAVQFDKPIGFRDVYWCHVLGEPIIAESDGMCMECDCCVDNSDDHMFICHIEKQPQKGLTK